MSLPFKTPKPQQTIEVGDKATGKVKVPVYGGLLTGEAIEIAKLFQQVSNELGKSVDDITDQDLVAYKDALALIALRYRVKGGEQATLEDLQTAPWSVVDALAKLMINELNAEALRNLQAVIAEEDEGGETKKEKSQPRS